MIQGSHNLQPIHPHLESAFWFVNLQNVVECSAVAHDVTGKISQVDTLASPLPPPPYLRVRNSRSRWAHASQSSMVRTGVLRVRGRVSPGWTVAAGAGLGAAIQLLCGDDSKRALASAKNQGDGIARRDEREKVVGG